MYIFNKIFSVIFSKQMFVLLVILSLAAVVWFFGPLLALGEFHPIASISMRISVIVMLLALMLFLLLKWPVSIFGIATLCLLIWHGGPSLAIGNSHPLAPVFVRAIAILIILFCCLIYVLYRLWQAMRTNETLLQRVLNPTGKQVSLANEEIRAVASTTSKAVQHLKNMRQNASGVRRIFEGKRYLYELPWYIIIGTPGAGKTTAIANSGLQFPLAEQMGSLIIKGKGGTTNCDWWFTNDAVLIDTAGRYTKQDDQLENKTSGEANAAEWHGFLRLLRKSRPRAPINGALLTVSVMELIDPNEHSRISLAAAMRERLAELRSQLGIRFPIYVVITKMDLLPGFNEYFQSLTTEGRAQVWGFTLPYGEETAVTNATDLRSNCQQELNKLEKRLDDGIENRLQEEYDIVRRKKLYALPQEFSHMGESILSLLEQVFISSRFDSTQLNTTLRGVYFTSAAQVIKPIVADQSTLFQRLRRAIEWASVKQKDSEEQNKVEPKEINTLPTGNRSYFLHNLFQRLIIPEANLVCPNLSWEFRFRILRMIGHLIIVVLFAWLMTAFATSYKLNSKYLSVMDIKTTALFKQVQTYFNLQDTTKLPELLTSAESLPLYGRLDLNQPGASWHYGLYAVPNIFDAAQGTYLQLQKTLLLPQIAHRIEIVLDAQIAAKDTDAVYNTLTVYLMLYDKKHYDASIVKNWVLQDWERSGSVSIFGSRASMLQHLNTLFEEDKTIQSPFVKDLALIQRARSFIDKNPAPNRLYVRAKEAMEKDSPEDFTLTRVIGPQAGAVFYFASRTPLDHGIPGIFTYDGYHQVFSKRLAEFALKASHNDEWLMGRRVSFQLGGAVTEAEQNKAVLDDIRRQYLIEYANRWTKFLNDIRPVNDSSNSLSIDLQTLRILSSPNSPLSRLVKAAVRETSLSTPTGNQISRDAYDSLANKAEQQLNRNSFLKEAIAYRPEQKMERLLVDNKFSALREVVTGQADPTSATQVKGVAPRLGKVPQLDSILSILNEQYTLLVVADNVLKNGGIPSTSEIGAQLRTESAKMPAPLQAILSGVSSNAAEKINNGIGKILSKQMDASIGDSCRSAIEGKYPFADSKEEVDPEDFSRVFARGGLLDNFFKKNLASYVDTTGKVWTYKAATTESPVINGPDLDPFQQADIIRQVFFNGAGAAQMSWKMKVKMVSLDPEILKLMINIDGQNINYAHGPIVPVSVSWPGPRGGAITEISAFPQVKPNTSSIITSGPWALFHLFDHSKWTHSASSNLVEINFDFDNRHAVLDLMSSSRPNPLSPELLRNFRCPRGSL